MAHVEKFQAAALGRMCGHYERRAEIDHAILKLDLRF